MRALLDISKVAKECSYSQRAPKLCFKGSQVPFKVSRSFLLHDGRILHTVNELLALQSKKQLNRSILNVTAERRSYYENIIQMWLDLVDRATSQQQSKRVSEYCCHIYCDCDSSHTTRKRLTKSACPFSLNSFYEKIQGLFGNKKSIMHPLTVYLQ